LGGGDEGEKLVEGVVGEGEGEGMMHAVEEKVEAFVEGVERKGGEVLDAVRHTEKEVERGLQETVRGNLVSGGQEAETAVLEGFEQARRGTGCSERAVGGSLDQRAEKMAEAGKKKVEGWGSWFGR